MSTSTTAHSGSRSLQPEPKVEVCHWTEGQPKADGGGKWVVIEIRQSALDAHLNNHDSGHKDCLCSDDVAEGCFCSGPEALFGEKECSGVCANNPICGEHGTCKPTAGGGVECECHTGYSGVPCLDIDECEKEIDECHANAFCTNTEGGFTCTCKEGFVAADDAGMGAALACVCPNPWKEIEGSCICPCSSEDDDCNLGVCDLLTGLCAKEPTKDGVICYDGNPCFQNNFCTNGKCEGGIPKDCSFLDDVCNEGECNVLTGTCEVHPTGAICEAVNNGNDKEENIVRILNKVSKPYDIEADINGDGTVDMDDAIALIAYLNETYGPESLSPPIPPDLFNQFSKAEGLWWLNLTLAGDYNSRNLDSTSSMNVMPTLQSGFSKGRGLLPFQCGNDVDEDGIYTKVKPGETFGEPPNRGFDDLENAGDPYDPSESPSWLDYFWWYKISEALLLAEYVLHTRCLLTLLFFIHLTDFHCCFYFILHALPKAPYP